MNALAHFDDTWPDDESRMVIDAIRSVVTDTSPRPATERLLSDAGRRWAEAHRSGTVMRARLEALGTLLDAEDEPARSDYLAALRLLTDAATWTSLDHLEREALVDPLTGAGNRRALELTLEGAAGAALHLGLGLVVVAIDLDGLKRINDRSGHPSGDRALVALVDALAGSVRASDAVFRTGGDEFAVVLQGTGLAETGPLMERVTRSGPPSFSWGAAALSPGCRTPAQLLAAADDDLYRRRNAVRRATATTATGPGAGERSGAGAEAGARAGAGAGAGGGRGAVLARISARRAPAPEGRRRVRHRTLVAAAAALVVGGVAVTVAGLSSRPPTRTASPPTGTPAGTAGTSTSGPGGGGSSLPSSDGGAATPTAGTPGPAPLPSPGNTDAAPGTVVTTTGSPVVSSFSPTRTAAPASVVTTATTSTAPAAPPGTGSVTGPVAPAAPVPTAPAATALPSPTPTATTTSSLGEVVSGLVGTVDGVAGSVGQLLGNVLAAVSGGGPAGP